MHSRDTYSRWNWTLRAVLALGMMLGAAPAFAQEEGAGFYVGGFGGVTWVEDQEAEGPAHRVDIGFDSGPALGAVIGYRLPDVGPLGNLRIEIEGAYRDSDVDEGRLVVAASGGGASFEAAGDADVYSYMGNVLFNFELTESIRPYVGGGVGIVDLDQSVLYGLVETTGDDTAFAYQAKVGLRFRGAHRIRLFVEGRYLDSADLDLTRTSPVDIMNLEADYTTIEAVAGVHFHF